MNKQVFEQSFNKTIEAVCAEIEKQAKEYSPKAKYPGGKDGYGPSFFGPGPEDFLPKEDASLIYDYHSETPERTVPMPGGTASAVAGGGVLGGLTGGIGYGISRYPKKFRGKSGLLAAGVGALAGGVLGGLGQRLEDKSPELQKVWEMKMEQAAKKAMGRKKAGEQPSWMAGLSLMS